MHHNWKAIMFAFGMICVEPILHTVTQQTALVQVGRQKLNHIQPMKQNWEENTQNLLFFKMYWNIWALESWWSESGACWKKSWACYYKHYTWLWSSWACWSLFEAVFGISACDYSSRDPVSSVAVQAATESPWISSYWTTKEGRAARGGEKSKIKTVDRAYILPVQPTCSLCGWG